MGIKFDSSAVLVMPPEKDLEQLQIFQESVMEKIIVIEAMSINTFNSIHFTV